MNELTPLERAIGRSNKKLSLLDDTFNAIVDYNLEVDDIEWVGTNDGVIPWKRFITLAKHTDYNQGDRGYKPLVRSDLVIVWKDYWLERYFNDEWRLEWWALRKIPKRPAVEDLTGTI